jgi:Sof1-like domain
VQARAHEQLGQLLPREKHKAAYDEALKQRYKHLPEVKRILRHRHLPAAIYKARAWRAVLLHLQCTLLLFAHLPQRIWVWPRCSNNQSGNKIWCQAQDWRGVQAGKVRREQKNAEKRKERNRITHSSPGTVKVKAARKKKMIAELE